MCTGSTNTEKEARKIFQVYVLLCFFPQLTSIFPLIKPLLLSIFFWAIIVSFFVQLCTRCILMITTSMKVWNVLHLSVRKRLRKAWLTLTPKWLLLTMGKQKCTTNINFTSFQTHEKLKPCFSLPEKEMIDKTKMINALQVLFHFRSPITWKSPCYILTNMPILLHRRHLQGTRGLLKLKQSSVKILSISWLLR